MSRQQRRAAARTKPAALVIDKVGDELTPPQHWHVGVFWYVQVGPNGNFEWSTHMTVVTNDVALAISYTRKRAGELSGPTRVHHHVDSLHQCSDPQHLEGLQQELLTEVKRAAA